MKSRILVVRSTLGAKGQINYSHNRMDLSEALWTHPSNGEIVLREAASAADPANTGLVLTSNVGLLRAFVIGPAQLQTFNRQLDSAMFQFGKDTHVGVWITQRFQTMDDADWQRARNQYIRAYTQRSPGWIAREMVHCVVAAGGAV